MHYAGVRLVIRAADDIARKRAKPASASGQARYSSATRNARSRDWLRSPYKQVSYGIALCFALPGIMSVLALVDEKDPAYWQFSFIEVALGGAFMLYRVHRNVPDMEQHHVLTYLSAIGLYLAIGLIALIGRLAKSAGPDLLRVDAILLTAVIFLGFNAAWLLLFNPVATGGKA
jgi:hypothetical protein